MFNPETGEWKHRHHQVFQDRRWLGSISYASGKMQYTDPPVPKYKGEFPQSFTECLSLAEGIFKKAEKTRLELADQSMLFSKEAEELRWFILPSEAQALLSNRGAGVKKTMPFEPQQFHATANCKQNDNSSVLSTSRPDLCEPQEEEWLDTKIFQSSVEHGFMGETEGNNSDKTLQVIDSETDSGSSDNQVEKDERTVTGKSIQSVPDLPPGEDTARGSSLEVEDTANANAEDTVNKDDYVELNSDVKSVSSDSKHKSVKSSNGDTLVQKNVHTFPSRTSKEIPSEKVVTNSGGANPKASTSLSSGIIQPKVTNTDETKMRTKSTHRDDLPQQFMLPAKSKDVSPVCKVTSKTECLPCMLPRRQETESRVCEEENRGTVAKFHAPPKNIFKPTLQVSLNNMSFFVINYIDYINYHSLILLYE